MATRSGTVSTIVLTSHRRPMRIPAARSHSGQKRDPLSQVLDRSSSRVLKSTRTLVQLRAALTPCASGPRRRHSQAARPRLTLSATAEAAAVRSHNPGDHSRRWRSASERRSATVSTPSAAANAGSQNAASAAVRATPMAAPCVHDPSRRGDAAIGAAGVRPVRAAGTPSHRSPSGTRVPPRTEVHGPNDAPAPMWHPGPTPA